MASLSTAWLQNRFKNFTNRLDDTSAIRKAKRDYARVVTLLREKGGAAPAPAAPAATAAPKPGAKKAAKRSGPIKARPKKTAATTSAKTAKKGEAK